MVYLRDSYLLFFSLPKLLMPIKSIKGERSFMISSEWHIFIPLVFFLVSRTLLSINNMLLRPLTEINMQEPSTKQDGYNSIKVRLFSSRENGTLLTLQEITFIGSIVEYIFNNYLFQMIVSVMSHKTLSSFMCSVILQCHTAIRPNESAAKRPKDLHRPTLLNSGQRPSCTPTFVPSITSNGRETSALITLPSCQNSNFINRFQAFFF